MDIKFSPRFRKHYKKSSKKIRVAFAERLRLFQENQYNPLLNNHSLTGSYKDLRSINITGDWRAIYSEFKDTIIFEMLGTHSQLYK